jgi:hypothetical protein
MPAVERHVAAAEHRLLGGVLKCRIVGADRSARPGQSARGVGIGKVGADRLAVAIDQAVRQRDPANYGNRADPEQDQAVASRTRRRQPFAGADSLPERSHFDAEFYECCATVAAGL